MPTSGPWFASGENIRGPKKSRGETCPPRINSHKASNGEDGEHPSWLPATKQENHRQREKRIDDECAPVVPGIFIALLRAAPHAVRRVDFHGRKTDGDIGKQRDTEDLEHFAMPGRPSRRQSVTKTRGIPQGGGSRNVVEPATADAALQLRYFHDPQSAVMSPTVDRARSFNAYPVCMSPFFPSAWAHSRRIDCSEAFGSCR
jgi:hypothetical protein